MSAKTKSARQSKAAKSNPKPAKAKASKPAKAKPAPEPEAPTESRSAQGRRIQDIINAGPVTIAQLVAQTGLSEKRVTDHVNFEINIRKRAKLNAKKQVVLTGKPPVRRKRLAAAG